MVYVISDLHGQYDKFIKMLEKIKFSKNDELYILGDIFDRGKQSLEIYEYIKDVNNIQLLLGNHEHMLLKSFDGNESYLRCWFQNGGLETFNAIKEKDKEYTIELLNYIKKLPTITIVENFILVHAGLYLPANCDELSLEKLIEIQDLDSLLWLRNDIENPRTYRNYTIVRGHTPTITINKKNKILHRGQNIFIDCGCYSCIGRLACLNLNTMEEYYV